MKMRNACRLWDFKLYQSAILQLHHWDSRLISSLIFHMTLMPHVLQKKHRHMSLNNLSTNKVKFYGLKTQLKTRRSKTHKQQESRSSRIKIHMKKRSDCEVQIERKFQPE